MESLVEALLRGKAEEAARETIVVHQVDGVEADDRNDAQPVRLLLPDVGLPPLHQEPR